MELDLDKGEKMFPNLLLLWAVPLAALVFDLAVRFADMKEWIAAAWGIYALSFIISAGIWHLFIFLVYLLKRRSRIAAVVFLILSTPGLAFIFLASYRAYFYFKFMPNYYIIDYIFTEAYHFWRIIQEYLPPIMVILILLAVLISVLLWTASGSYLKRVPAKKWLLGGECLLWLAALAVYNNNLRIFDQSSLPDSNFFVIVGQIYYNRLTNAQLGTSGFKHRIIPELERTDLIPSFNILIMLQESLRPDHMSIYGYARDTTPDLRRFFASHKGEVFLFDEAQSHSTTTQLSVPTILQGLNPSVEGKYWHSSPVIFEYAKMMEGMSTFFISAQRWHWQNYDVFLQSSALDYVWSQETSGLPAFNDTGVDDREMVKEFIRHISKLNAEPSHFLGVIGFNATHCPYIMPKEYHKWSGWLIDEYDDSIYFLDSIFGTAFDYLEKSGILNNTIIIFTSDHAEAFGEHKFFGHAHFHYESMHVPFWIFIPRSLQAKIAGMNNLKDNTKKIVSNQDIPATILDLYGLYDLGSIAQFRGRMQGGSLLRKIDESRPIFSLNQTDISMIAGNHGLSLIADGKKYLIEVTNNKVEEQVYDLYKDPKETNNLWSSLAESEKEKFRRLVLSYPNSAAIYKRTVLRSQARR